ncbi:MAG: GAF domain-containing protein [Pyrinomonadaceae bacterium]
MERVNGEGLNEELIDLQRCVLLGADISLILNQNGLIDDALHTCTDAIVKYLDAAFARVWTLNTNDQVLELRASSGLYTHLDGGHSRVPVGKFKIGWIAAERQPHLTNSVVGDERVGDQEWAVREGMVSFAGYPLLVGDDLVGVVGMFGRQPFSL